jgi:phosphonate transport system substrate-binding protein
MFSPTDSRNVLKTCIGGLIVFVLAFLILTGCGEPIPTIDLTSTGHAGVAGSEKPRQLPELRVAVGAMISPEVTRQYYQALFELITNRIGRQAVFMQRRTYAEINELVEKRQVDLAFVCSGPYTEGHEKFGLELLVVPVVHGETVYRSYILARADSRIRSFDDLRGCRFAFTDPNSNTGFLVPRIMLSRRHESPESFFKETFFTYSHDNSIKAVAEGLADGAAVDSLIWEFLNAVDPSVTDRTRIVEKSPPYGIPPIVIHPDMDRALKEELRIRKPVSCSAGSRSSGLWRGRTPCTTVSGKCAAILEKSS